MAETTLDIIINAVDNASKEFDKVSKSAGGMGLASKLAIGGGIAALGGAVTAIGKKAFDASMEFDAAMDALVISTGKSGAAIDEMGGLVKDLYGGQGGRGGRGLQDIADVVGKVAQRTDLSGASLAKYTDQLFKLSNLTGTDAATNVEELSKLMNRFGIDAEESAGKLDLLFAGTQRTGLGLGDLVTSLQTLAPITQAWGMDLNGSTAFLADLTSAGIDASTAQVGLKSAMIALQEDGIEPGDAAWRNLVERINGPDGLNVAVEYFGAKAGPAFFQAIRDGKLDVDSMWSALDQTKGSLDQVTDETEGWEEAWKTAMNKIELALMPVGDAMTAFLNDNAPAFTAWFETTVPQAISKAINWIDSFITKLGEMQTATPSMTGLEAGTSGMFGPGQMLNEMVGVQATDAIINQLRTLRDSGPSYIDDDAINNWIAMLAQGRLNQTGDIGITNPQNLPFNTNPNNVGPGVQVNIYGNATTQDIQNGLNQALQGQGVR